jgi:hypothetical protein
VTVLLARNRPPPPTAAAGVPHAELAAGLVTLPSGLLAMVCEAIVKLKVRLGAAGVRARSCGLLGRLARADEVATRAQRLSEYDRVSARLERWLGLVLCTGSATDSTD